MTITTFAIGAAVTPTVVKTYVSHYANRKPRRQKPTAHISYDEGLNLVRTFLDYASHKTVEDLQAFTAQWVPHPSWVRTENVTIPPEYISKSANTIVKQLGPRGVGQVGGSKWWQWRRKGSELKAEWIEMKSHYNERKQANGKCRRVMLYIHGGGFFFGSVDEHRYQLQRHARKLKARVIAPRYRLAPQFPFPCGLHDCLAVYLYLLTMHDPREIIVAGDSAGGGMAVSMMCILRDQGLPLPSGAILISPWVDLTHSFPSVAAPTDFDYIPPHGFQQRPSPSWPPPNEDDLAEITTSVEARATGEKVPRKPSQPDRKATEREAIQGFAEISPTDKNEDFTGSNGLPKSGDSNPENADVRPGPHTHLSIEIDGKRVLLKDQIQMYATNQLLSHPLVSPILQPSLGGLPPLLILTGGGEVLRDEQIYLAHKAANPSKYPLGDLYRSQYDPGDVLLNSYKPTHVQLQVWEDLCHVAPTLSFTRPAKFMYRSIAQFGAWALARAQNRAIEIVDDDNISVISSESESDSESEPNDSSDSVVKRKPKNSQSPGSIGKAGDPLPTFKNNMIRQHVDRHGNIYPLAPAHDLPATQMDPNHVGIIKPGPVRKWMEAKRQWDTRYAHDKRSVQKRRIKQLTSGGSLGFGADEHPPPSALAGRRTDKDLEEKKKRKSYGLAMWSMWGSKHDEQTIKREEEATQQDNTTVEKGDEDGIPEVNEPKDQSRRSTSRNRTRRFSKSGKQNPEDRSRSRRRTISVTDRGQTEGLSDETAPIQLPVIRTDSATPGATSPSKAATPTASSTAIQDHYEDQHETSHLSPIFIPKFKTSPHLQSDLHDHSDAASTMTGHSQVISDNASTMAVFSAPGVSRNTADEPDPVPHEEEDNVSPGLPYHHHSGTGGAVDGYDTPASRRSMERLLSHQIEAEGTAAAAAVEGSGSSDAYFSAPTMTQGLGLDGAQGGLLLPPQTRFSPLRSPSSTAIVKAEGVVGVVEGGEADRAAETTIAEKTPSTSQPEPGTSPSSSQPLTAKQNQEQRPGLYARDDSEFKTAMEML